MAKLQNMWWWRWCKILGVGHLVLSLSAIRLLQTSEQSYSEWREWESSSNQPGAIKNPELVSLVVSDYLGCPGKGAIKALLLLLLLLLLYYVCEAVVYCCLVVDWSCNENDARNVCCEAKTDESFRRAQRSDNSSWCLLYWSLFICV